MQTQLQRIKIKPIIFDDYYLSIEHTTCGQRSAQWFQQLRKVTIEWFFVAALDENLISIAKHKRAKTIPLGLENPIALGAIRVLVSRALAVSADLVEGPHPMV